jgi:hypothetical protein
MPTLDPKDPTRRSPIATFLLLTSVVLAQACDGGGSSAGRDAASGGATGGAASGGTKGGTGGSGVAGTTGAGSGGGGIRTGTGGTGVGGATLGTGGGGGIQAGTGGAGVGGTTRGTGGAGSGGVGGVGGGAGGGKGGAGGGTGGQSTADASPIPDASPNTDTSPALDGDKRDAQVGKDNASPDLAGDLVTQDGPARDSADAPADVPVGQDDAATDLGADALPASLDDCFAGLPAPVGIQIVSNKSSADGRVHLRLALDTLGNMGLGYAWSLIRFGIEIDGTVTCIKDKTALKYTMSRHNCTDTASATSGTTRYDMGSPSDTMTSLQIFESGTQTSSMTLTTSSCTRTGSTVACPPTGPC